MIQARILPRMERPRPQLPPPPCLLPIALALLPTSRHAHNLPRQLPRARTSHELHHEETARLRIHLYDASIADCDCAEVEIFPGEDYS